MHPFKYVRAVDDATALKGLTEDRAMALGGGTNLVDMMRLDIVHPGTLVDISRLARNTIEVDGDGLTIGATARNSDVANHPAVKEGYAVLSEALLAGASPQIRNLATVGGNLLQRTRCAYFRDAGVKACNKRIPGSGCAAMDGWTRMHAILGTSPACIATHPSDMCVALAALDATVHVISAQRGPRSIPFASFHVRPEQHPEIETTRQADELIDKVTMPPFKGFRSTYVKARDRASYAFALASCAAAVLVEGGTIKDARIALGGVATVPWRSHDAEAALIGKPAAAATFEAAAKAAVAGAAPRRGNEFKVVLAQRVIVRALHSVTA